MRLESFTLFSIPLNPLRQSLVALLGVPLLAYAIAMVTLAGRAKIALPGMVAWGTMGLAGLYYLGGFVLLTSACSYGSSGQ